MFRGSSWTQTSSSSRRIAAPAPRASRSRGRSRAAPPGRWPGDARPSSPPRPADRSRSSRCRAPPADLPRALRRPTGSSSTGRQAPSASSSSRELACGRRSRLFGRHDDQRALPGAPRLAAEQVEVLRRRGRVGDADVALGRELEEPLQPRARMLGALALVAVRQEQGEPRREPPLGEPRGEELVDDDLGAVDEVAELRLPEHQRLRAPRRCSRTRSPSVASSDSGLLCSSSGASAPGSFWIGAQACAGLRVVQHQVALAEGAALGVLSGEPDRHAFGQQRGERQRLGVGPVDAALRAQRRAAALELLPELGMDGEALGPASAAAR